MQPLQEDRRGLLLEESSRSTTDHITRRTFKIQERCDLFIFFVSTIVSIDARAFQFSETLARTVDLESPDPLPN